MAKIIFKLENARTHETGDLEGYVANNMAEGTQIPLAFKGSAKSNSSVFWQPLDNWILRDVIGDGSTMGGVIRLMESSAPTAATVILAAQAPTNPGRPKYNVVLSEKQTYSFEATTTLTVS